MKLYNDYEDEKMMMKMMTMIGSITWKMRPVYESLTATWLPVSSVCIHLRNHHHHHVDEEDDEQCSLSMMQVTLMISMKMLCI